MILYAANDPVLAREFRAYQQGLEAGLAKILERLGIHRPLDAARTIVDLGRGFELERFTYPTANLEDLRRRVTTVVEALFAPTARKLHAAGPTSLDRLCAERRGTSVSRGYGAVCRRHHQRLDHGTIQPRRLLLCPSGTRAVTPVPVPPLHKQIFFAGEAVALLSHSSVPGAYESGQTAAQKVLKALK